ncbi:hypothetical protein EZS27_004433 [termite gut metagenome]|uniref:Uncharacterized protein n=1 Tax=termite gut metagenome TaxID=433724 RepID=A0A5J4SPL2_9ZZZZ
MNVQVKYNQVLDMVYQLSPSEINSLLQTLQTNVQQTQIKKDSSKLTKMQKILLQAPTWSDEEYNQFLEARKHHGTK